MASIDFPLTLSRSLKNVIEVLYWTQTHNVQAHGRVHTLKIRRCPLQSAYGRGAMAIIYSGEVD